MSVHYKNNPSWKNLTPHNLGREGERIALDLLKTKKYKIIQRGFRMFRGEIDIIACDGEDLVFIEVKARRGIRYGYPEEYVTPSKQRQIKKIAWGYVNQNDISNIPCRFDVIAVTFLDEEAEVVHCEDAFT
jgi:putative endonuclease